MNLLQTATESIRQHLHEPYATLLIAITYGESIRTLSQINRWVMISGCAHMIVLSGTNITVLIALIETLTKELSFKLRLISSCLLIFLFMALVGPEPPLARAVAMATLTALAHYYGLVSYPLWNLFLSVLAIGIIRPEWISSLSLHLSVMATLGIIISARISHTKKFHPLIGLLIDSLLAQICTLPIIIFTFRSFSVMATISTIMLSWTIAPLMVCGLFIPLLHFICPPLVHIPTLIANGLLIYVYHTLRYLGSFTMLYFQFD